MAFEKLFPDCVVKQCKSSWKYITETTPNPEWHEYFNLSYSDNGWTVDNPPTIEVKLTVEIALLWGSALDGGTVILTNEAVYQSDGLLDLSKNSWCRMCRSLEPAPSLEPNPSNRAGAVLALEVIAWPNAEQPKPSRATDHLHTDQLHMLVSGGLALVHVEEEYRKRMKINCDKWSIKMEDNAFSGALSPMCGLTLPPPVLERLGVPLASTHFCFAYGNSETNSQRSPELRRTESGNYSREFDQMVSNGAFCYFHKCADFHGGKQCKKGCVMECGVQDCEKCVMECVFEDLGLGVLASVKAVSDNSHKEAGCEDVSFGSWEVVADRMMPALEKKYFHPVTIPQLLEFNLATFTFVHPSEEINGDVFPYGGFVYRFHDGSKPVILEISKGAKVHSLKGRLPAPVQAKDTVIEIRNVIRNDDFFASLTPRRGEKSVVQCKNDVAPTHLQGSRKDSVTPDSAALSPRRRSAKDKALNAASGPAMHPPLTSDIEQDAEGATLARIKRTRQARATNDKGKEHQLNLTNI